jgi:osmoprotectant transport system permease protein
MGKFPMRHCTIAILVGLGLWAGNAHAQQPPQVRPGSKAFTESGILGEMLTLLARIAGANATHRASLSGTQIAWGALVKGEIDCYVDYTGTIRKEMLPGRDLPTEDALRNALAEQGIRMSRPLGFANTYAIGMKKDKADRLGIRKVSDLKKHPELKFGFTAEFLDRADGWPGLRAHYQLPQTSARGMEHALAYESLETGSIDATDLYSTDAKIRTHDLQVLTDDLHYFPNYDAVLLYRADLEQRAPQVVTALRQLEGRISERDMVELNSRVELDKAPEVQAAADFLRKLGLLRPEDQMYVRIEGPAARLWRLTEQHLFLSAVSLLAAIVVALPLGILSAYRPAVGQVILGTAGVLQTIPSIALLVFMIPFLGIGPAPAIAALFLYSILPIVRNTHAGLTDIPLPLRESAEALGLPGFARLWRIELPMAARTILAGIKTAAVINVGTATLGGFIGAGGYGELIFTGLYKDDKALILQGAIPTALLALLVQGVFELAERWLVPLGLRLKPAA